MYANTENICPSPVLEKLLDMSSPFCSKQFLTEVKVQIASALKVTLSTQSKSTHYAEWLISE